MELPRYEPLWNKYRDKGFSVVVVEADRNREGALKFVKENQLTYHLLENLEGDDEVVRNVFNVGGFPQTFIIDSDGKVMFFHRGTGPDNEAIIEGEIIKLLEER